MTVQLQQAYNHCQRVAKEHAKNFYYAFRTLPAPKRQAIYAAYAFCRICDDIADEELPLYEKRTLFEDLRRQLAQSRDGATDHPVFAALKDAASTYGIPYEYFEEVVQGVEMDLAVTRFQAFDDLRAYCYKVASVVGLICIEVFGYQDSRAREHAVDLGLAMQLTNILRDIKEDAERGRIYIPLDELDRFGYSEADLMAGVPNNAFRSLMRFQVARARWYFESGRQLIPLLSPESRACPAVLHGVYSSVLDRIEASGYNVFERRIGLSTAEKLFLMVRLWATSRIPSVALPKR